MSAKEKNIARVPVSEKRKRFNENFIQVPDVVREDLVERFEASGLTIDQLAKRINVSRGNTHNLLHGNASLSLNSARKIAIALGAPSIKVKMEFGMIHTEINETHAKARV